MTDTTAAIDVRRHLELAAASALAEDLDGGGPSADVTTAAVVPPGAQATAEIVAKAPGVLCGSAAIAVTLDLVGGGVAVVAERDDGDRVQEGDVIARLRGSAAPILVAERTILNLLAHLSGVATLVRAFVDRAPEATLVDTRKTTPGLRVLEKYAVRTGGGANHRMGLWDGVLVKDNHIAVAGGVRTAVERARTGTSLPVQVEVTSADELREAIASGADAVLLDNTTPDGLASLVALAREGAPAMLLEASGGITLDTVAAVAATGVDRISVGAFTHSAPALDLSLRFEPS